MAYYEENLSDSNNGWNVTIYWQAEYGDTSVPVYWTINQNSYSRTFQLVKRYDTDNRYNSGSYLEVGAEYWFYVYKNGTYSQQAGPITITAPSEPPTVNYSWKSLGSGSASSVSFSLSTYQVGYYLFTPPSNGTLIAYSSSSYDTYGGILDNSKTYSLGNSDNAGSSIVSGTKLGSTTDDNSNMDFYCSGGTVTAGKTYRIYVHEYNGDPSISGTLYMTFTPDYSITYYANGKGTAPAAQTVARGESITLRGAISNQTINTYTVSYNANGGDTIPSNQISTKTYKQLSWNTTSSGNGTSYTPGGSYTPTGDLKLYAIWDTGTPNSITLRGAISKSSTTSKRIVYFNANSGSCTTTSSESSSTTTYTFNGWQTNNILYQAGDTYTPTQNTTMTASWTPYTGSYSSISLPNASKSNSESLITIKINANGGKCDFESYTVKGITQYSFDGWYNGSTKVGDSENSYIPPSNNITLTAQYNISSTTYNSILLPVPYPRTGYTFKGWSTNKNATSGLTGYYTPNGNQTLYAIWEKNTYIYLSKDEKMKRAQPFIFYNGKWYKCQSWINKKSKWKEAGG